MADRRSSNGRPPATTGEARRTASGRLRERIASAPAAALETLLDDPSIGEPEIVLLLRNRAAPRSVLTRIARRRAWVVNREIRRLLVEHPNTPHVLSLDMLPHLFWKELADVSRTPGAHPIVRRRAEDLLRTRIGRMTAGERTTLARLATRALIPELIETEDAGVLLGALGNPRLLEREATRIAAARRSPASVLDHLARFSHWSSRPSVRSALLRNRNTPVAAALGLLRGMERRELARLARDPAVQPSARIRAERLLAGRPGSGLR